MVTAIAAPAALRVSFSGDGGHAGAQLMPLRNDASLAGAELALFVERTVLATGQLSCRAALLPASPSASACPFREALPPLHEAAVHAQQPPQQQQQQVVVEQCS